MQNKARLYAKVLSDSLEKVSESEAQKRIRRFRNLLKKRGDLRLLSTILQEFHRIWKERKGKVAQAVSAKPLGATLENSLETKLRKQGFILESKVEESVGGGVALYLGNEYLVDNTIKGRLKRIWQKTF